MQEPCFLPCVRGGNSAVPTHAPGPACSSSPALLAPGSQAGPLALSLAPASFLAAPGSTSARYSAGSRAFIAGWLLTCFSTGPRSPGKGMLHGSPAPEPRSVVGTTMPRLELEGVCHGWPAPLLSGSSVLGQGYSLHIPQWVRTSFCLTLPNLPCCVLGAGDPALLPCWGPAHDNPPATLKLLQWLPAPVAFQGCLCLMPPTLLPHCSPGAGNTPSLAWPSRGLAACNDGQPSQAAAPARLGHSFLPKSSLPLPSWGHRCLPPNHTLRLGCADVATVLLVPLINTSLQVPAVSRPVVLPSEVRLAGKVMLCPLPAPSGA